MILSFILTSLFVFSCSLLILLILIQKGKSSMGMGGMGGGSQMLFGGSGGQDLFQKITWLLGAIFMFGSLTLSIMKSNERQASRFVQHETLHNEAAPIQEQLPE